MATDHDLWAGTTPNGGTGASRGPRYGVSVVLGAILALVGFVLTAITQTGSPPPPVQPDPAPDYQAVAITGSVLLLDDGRTLEYTDPDDLCRASRLTATEDNRVVLALAESGIAGLGDCGIRSQLMVGPPWAFAANPLDRESLDIARNPLRVSLRGSLGSQTLVDAFTGATVPYFDVRSALWPYAAGLVGFDSTGSRFGSVSSAMPYFGGPGAAVMVENFTTARSENGEKPIAWVRIVQVIGGGWHPPPTTRTTAVVVRGHQGRAGAGIIVWSEGGRTIAVVGETLAPYQPPTTPGPSGVDGHGTPMPTAQLLAVAASLRAGQPS